MPPLIYLLGAGASGTILGMIFKKKISCLWMKRLKLNNLEEINKALNFANLNVWNGKVKLVIKVFTDIEYSCCMLDIKDKFKIDLVKEAILNFNPYVILKDEKLKNLKGKSYTMVLTGQEIILTYDFRSVKIDYKNKGLIIS